MFQYFRVMCTTKSHLRYFDYLGNVFDAWGKTRLADSKEIRSRCSSSAYPYTTSGAALSPSTTKTRAP